MLTVRVPIALLDRADALIDAIAADSDIATALGARVTRSSVLRFMLVEGAKALERRYRYAGLEPSCRAGKRPRSYTDHR